jgi:hypothetical protein
MGAAGMMKKNHPFIIFVSPASRCSVQGGMEIDPGRGRNFAKARMSIVSGERLLFDGPFP